MKSKKDSSKDLKKKNISDTERERIRKLLRKTVKDEIEKAEKHSNDYLTGKTKYRILD